MQAKILDLKFKGSRVYAHGTDFFNQVSNVLSDFFPEAKSTRVTQIIFRAFAKKQCALAVVSDEIKDRVVSDVLVDIDGKEEMLAIIEVDQDITARYAYDETKITNLTQIESDSITLNTRSGYTLIEEIVALNKQLNYADMPNVAGQWLFTRFDLESPLQEDAQHIVVQRSTSIPNRYTVSDVIIDKNKIGQIHFAVGKP